jgi:galactose-1-phosphate uridylyltransferase
VNQGLCICDSFKTGQSFKFENELKRIKKENIALAEKNSLSECTLATLQEEYESVLEKLDNCAETNENLFELNKSLKAQNQLFEREIGSSKMDYK